ncbi:hypothetical protein CC77DRAFT_984088 [Alternaria alternata]|uniref:Uncharacterized protein n=1 Tax=Alternaria alternata TaxID=5599 RepID=A0A177DVP8_ALTAL|nr:hypothetical protein CC77DRAFT_984088 [Alternaria alternata]OAG23261.1 hypothetical protein CC77DRAFT_984088 [Alternaria alternata]
MSEIARIENASDERCFWWLPWPATVSSISRCPRCRCSRGKPKKLLLSLVTCSASSSPIPYPPPKTRHSQTFYLVSTLFLAPNCNKPRARLEQIHSGLDAPHFAPGPSHTCLYQAKWPLATAPISPTPGRRQILMRSSNSLHLLCPRVLVRTRRHSHHLRNQQLQIPMAHLHRILKDSRGIAGLLRHHQDNSLNLHIPRRSLRILNHHFPSRHSQIRRLQRSGINPRFHRPMDNHLLNSTSSKTNGANHNNPLTDSRRSSIANLTANSPLISQMFVLI